LESLTFKCEINCSFPAEEFPKNKYCWLFMLVGLERWKQISEKKDSDLIIIFIKEDCCFDQLNNRRKSKNHHQGFLHLVIAIMHLGRMSEEVSDRGTAYQKVST